MFTSFLLKWLSLQDSLPVRQSARTARK